MDTAINEPILVARGLSLITRQGTVFEGVDLTLSAGEVCALLGAEGSGKTALLLTFAGRMKQTAGTLEVAGLTLPKQRYKAQRLVGMGFFAGLNEAQPSLTVEATVAAELHFSNRANDERSTAHYLHLWGLQAFAGTAVKDLTSEQRLRLGIALGMAGGQRVLVLDSIEDGLDNAQSTHALNYLKAVAIDTGIAVVFGCLEEQLAARATHHYRL